MQKTTAYKLARALILVILIAGLPLSVHAFSSQVTSVAAGNIVITPEADAYIRSSSPNTNYGTRSYLYVDRKSIKNSYLRFSVTGYDSNVTQVIFRIYANSSNSIGFSISKVADNSWLENEITFNNAPPIGDEVAHSGFVKSKQWINVDISNAISGDGTYSFALSTSSSTNTNYASRESGDRSPQIVLSTEAVYSATPILPPPTATPTVGSFLTNTPTSIIVPTQTPTSGLLPTNTPTSVNSPTQTPTSPTATSTPLPTVVPTNTGDPVLVGAGDIASCSSSGDEATASLVNSIAGTVFTTGDNVYDNGTSTEFTNCYDPSWGQFKNRTKPSPGNHDYNSSGASGYYGYFGSAAGDPSKGYYSYDLGSWHVIVLNSEISTSSGSAQVNWLLQDLANNPSTCTLAYWHRPRFSSGSAHGSSASLQTIWQALYDYHADVVVNGHEHNYERFAPQTPSGAANPNGLVEFVAGMGGRSHYGFGTILSNSVARNSDTYGVLKLTLHDKSYSWEFVPQSGKSYSDSGSAACVP